MQNIASKGGQASHSGGFASMDSDKQVSITRLHLRIYLPINFCDYSVILLPKAGRPLEVLLNLEVRKLERQAARVAPSETRA